MRNTEVECLDGKKGMDVTEVMMNGVNIEGPVTDLSQQSILSKG